MVAGRGGNDASLVGTVDDGTGPPGMVRGIPPSGFQTNFQLLEFVPLQCFDAVDMWDEALIAFLNLLHE